MRYDLDLEVSLEELAILFAAYGWYYATNPFGTPSPDDIKQQIYALLNGIPDEGEFIRSGRLALVRSPEYPDSFEVYLDIGYLSPPAGDEVAKEVAA